MADDLQILLAGAIHTVASDDVGVVGERQVLYQKILSAQLNSVAPLDKLIGAAFAAGTDTGLAMLGVLSDHLTAFAGEADGTYGIPKLDPGGRMQAYSDGMRKRFKDEFSGAAVDATKWTVTTFGGGSATVAGSVLTLNTGDALSGSGVELISVDTYQAPCRLLAILNSISQRIANQEFSIELVEETTVAGTAGTDGAKILFNGTSVTGQQITTLCTGDQDGPTAWTAASSAVADKYEIDLMPDEVWFYDTGINSIAARVHYAHQDRKVPDPNKRYRIRLRLRNTAAAASATTALIDMVMLEDNAYLPVEIAHARGSNPGSSSATFQDMAEALPVLLNNPGIVNTVVGVGDKSIWNDETATALGGAATFTGTARDMAATTSTNSIAGYGGTFRALALQDVVGTLYIEVSADNVTFYRVTGKALTQFDATARFSAWIEFPVMTRYARAVLVNGAGAATLTRVFSKQNAMPGT